MLELIRKIAIAFICLMMLKMPSMAQVLKGEVDPALGITSVTLHCHKISDYKQYKIDTAQVTDGTYVFHFTRGEEPAQARLLFKDDNGKWVFGQEEIRFFLDGDTVLVFGTTSMQNIKVYNSISSYDFALLNEMLEHDWNYYQDMSKRSNALSQASPAEVDRRALQHFLINRYSYSKSRLNVVYKQFIKNHPASWVSLYAFRKVIADYNEDISDLAELFSKLDKHLRESPSGQDLLERISNRTNIRVGEKAPDFRLPNAKGEWIDLKHYQGKYVLLEFWASTCGACRREAPHLIDAYNEYNNKGFEILGISLDYERFDGRKRWLNAVEKDGVHLWEQVCDLQGHDSPVALMYDVKAIPQNFLLDPDGKIIAQNLKGADLHQLLEKLLKGR